VIEGVRVAVRHGTPKSDMEGIYPERVRSEDAQRWLDDACADVLLVGHTHLPFALTTSNGRLIANPGALLREPADQPEHRAPIFDPDRGQFVPGPAAGGGTFGVLDLPSKRFTVHGASDGGEVAVSRLRIGANPQ
jgi:hypothetical protein